jgi:hypothetical protein
MVSIIRDMPPPASRTMATQSRHLSNANIYKKSLPVEGSTDNGLRLMSPLLNKKVNENRK